VTCTTYNKSEGEKCETCDVKDAEFYCEKCKSGLYKSELGASGKCLECGVGCQICQDETGTCEQCESGYAKNDGKEGQTCAKVTKVKDTSPFVPVLVAIAAFLGIFGVAAAVSFFAFRGQPEQ